MISPTAIINLNNLKNNIHYIQTICGASTLFPVIKANAYGHGLAKTAKFLDSESIKGICVATCKEILEVIKLDLRINILHLGRISLSDKKLFNNKIIYTINCKEDIFYINNICKKFSKKIRCHIKIDTGMNRMGCKESDFMEILDLSMTSKYISLEGVYSHLACADDSNSLNNKHQISLFKRIIDSSKGCTLKYHILNSAGLFNYTDSKYNIVRCGLSLYGVSPFSKINNNLLPVMTFKAPIVLIKNIKQNESVGYGCTYIAKESKKIGIVQCGYADGIPRDFGNKGSVYFDTYELPIIGRVSMDLLCIDISSLNDIEDFKEVVIWGGEQKSSRLEMIASKFNTIPYTFLTGITDRVERVYVQE